MFVSSTQWMCAQTQPATGAGGVSAGSARSSPPAWHRTRKTSAVERVLSCPGNRILKVILRDAERIALRPHSIHLLGPNRRPHDPSVLDRDVVVAASPTRWTMALGKLTWLLLVRFARMISPKGNQDV
jgi:hypothetical protein